MKPNTVIYNGVLVLDGREAYAAKIDLIRNPMIRWKANIVAKMPTPGVVQPISPEQIQRVKKKIATNYSDGLSLEYIAVPLKNDVCPVSFWNNWQGCNFDENHGQVYDYFKKILAEIVRYREIKSAIVVGCGTGDILDYLQSKGIRATGLDSNIENVRTALSHGRNVQWGKLEELSTEQKVDLVFDPGILSEDVLPRELTQICLTNIANVLNKKGTFIHIPFTASHITAFKLRGHNFHVDRCTEPANMFTYDYPKQVYVAFKH